MRKRRTDVSTPRVNSFDDVKKSEPKVMQGTWTDTETVALFVCQIIVAVANEGETNESIITLYNMISNHQPEFIRSKTERQITSKLSCMKKY